MYLTSNDSYIKYYFNDNSKNKLLSLGYRNMKKTKEHLLSYADQYHCSIVLNGQGTYKCNGSEYPLVKNSIYQRFPDSNDSINIELSDDWLEYHICIGASAFDSLKSMNALNIASPVFKMSPEPYLYRWMDDQATPLLTNSLDDIFELFFNTQKLIRAIHKANIQSQLTNEKERLQAALPMLSMNFSEPLSLYDIASSFGFSYETFRKKFKEHIGISPLQFRLKCKFHLAQRMLCDGYSISEVAEETGYTDSFTFSKQFKKYVGKSPKEFKP